MGTGALDAILTRLGDVRAASSSTAAQVVSDVAVIAEHAERIATRADDLRERMRQLGEDGNQWGTMAADIIASVEEGLTDKLAAVNAFGDGLTVVDGQVRSIRDLLTAVLPTMGEVQARIRADMEQLKADGVTLEKLMERLS